MNNTPLWLIWFAMLGIVFNTGIIARDFHDIKSAMHLEERT